MAFKNKNLSVIAYANGFTLWHYAANEPLSEITAKNYFLPVHTLMNNGDIVIINADKDTALRKVSMTGKGVVCLEALA